MEELLNSRKAQITVFIIIGVIILFSVGIYGYLRMTSLPETEAGLQKADPVVAFIDACLERTAQEAISVMGTQGGYITVPPAIAYDPTKHVSLVPGVGGEYVPKVPYWYFDGASHVPSIDFMQVQVQEYVNNNLAYCFNNFSTLTDEYIITERSNFSSDVVFAEKETVIGLDYEIDVTPRGRQEVTKRDRFLVKLDVPVKRMHALAKEILEQENLMTFFENMTINLMSSHPSDDIPFTGMDFSCVRKRWLLSDIKRKLNTALEPAVSAVRFKNTDHPPFKGKDDDYRAVHNAVQAWRESQLKTTLVLPKNIPSDSYDYFQYYFQFTDNDYKDMKVVATYKKDWGMRLLGTPNEYGVLKSGTQDMKSEILSYLCLNTYHFVYDLVYPVTISINYPEAFHNDGFVFRYAFPVQIFHNTPDRTLLTTEIVEPAEYDIEYCGLLENVTRVIRARDAVTNAELSRVNLTFRCLTEQCPLGVTRTNNRHLQWSGQFPEGCVGPLIVGNRSGYLLTEKQYDYSVPFYLDMYPTQPVKFEVKRHAQNAPASAKMLEPDMYVIIQVEHKAPPLSVFDVFGGKEIFNRTDTFELLRADATYDLNIMLMKKISKDEDRLIGGWMGNWTVAIDDILDAEKVVFHVPQKYPIPTSDEEVISVYEIMTNRSLFPEAKHEIIRADEYTGESET